jgi:hypothetical protein
VPVLAGDQRRQVELEDERPIVATKHEQEPQAVDRRSDQIAEEGGKCPPFIVLVKDQVFLELVNNQEQRRTMLSVGIGCLFEKIAQREFRVGPR